MTTTPADSPLTQRVQQEQGEGLYAYSMRCMKSSRARVETLLRLVLKELLLRKRSVRVRTPNDWNRLGSSGYLREHQWSTLWVTVDGLRFAVQWTPVRWKEDYDYATDRIKLRICKDPEGGAWARRTSTRTASEDAKHILEPPSGFDPTRVVEWLERWMVERRKEQATREEMERRAKARQDMQNKLRERIVAAGPLIRQHSASCDVRSVPSGPRDKLVARVTIRWEWLSVEEAEELISTLEQSFKRASAESFTIPD